MTVVALWVVDPFEIVALEPAHEGDDHAVLVSPSWLCVWAQ